MKELLPEREVNLVLEVLAEELSVNREQLNDSASLEHDLGADSLTLVEINMSLEDRLGVVIPDERAEKLRTVGDVFALLAELLASRR